jgi:hypothetical protein
MPSLCTNLVTRIPDHSELVRPKRGTSNEEGYPVPHIVRDGSLFPTLLSRLSGEGGEGKRDCAIRSLIGGK